MGLFLGTICGIIGGLIFGLVFGLVSGLVGGFTDRVKVDKAYPNQGINLSLRNSLAVFLVIWLLTGLIGGLIGRLSGTGLMLGLLVGLFFGLIAGLNRGGSAVIKHYALRLTLWLNGYTPIKFIGFLDQCAKLIVLKKVGGGYIFIHRMLLEYFAEMTPSSTRTEDGTRGGQHGLPINWSRRIIWASVAVLVCAASLWFFVLVPRAELFSQAVATSHRALEVYVRDRFPQQWAAIQYNLGQALYDESVRSEGVKATELLDQALAAYQRALEVYMRDRFPQQWTATQYSLGHVLNYKSVRSEGAKATELLDQALAAYRLALEVYTRYRFPQQWATTQNDLGEALWDLGSQLKGGEGLKRQRESIEVFRELIAYQPSDHSRILLAQHLGGFAFYLVLNSQFAEALTRSEEALSLVNEIVNPYGEIVYGDDLIFIQGKLAHTLLFQGHFDKALAIYRKNWNKPFSVIGRENWYWGKPFWGIYREALRGKDFGEITLEDFAAFDKAGLHHPDLSRMKQLIDRFHWAATQHSLGQALYSESVRNEGAKATELLDQALAACRLALEVYTPDVPEQWTTTLKDLGSALWYLGSQSNGEEGLKRLQEAVEMFRRVMSAQPDEDARYKVASMLGELAFKLVLNRQFAEARAQCEEAQSLVNGIVNHYGEIAYGGDLIFIQGNLAHALLFQGHYDEALAIYRHNWNKPLWGKTFGEVTLEDFAAFDKAGLKHPDLSRMKQALGGLGSEAPSPGRD
jgi:tetratricopeptide (TPR) repeat protein